MSNYNDEALAYYGLKEAAPRGQSNQRAIDEQSEKQDPKIMYLENQVGGPLPAKNKIPKQSKILYNYGYGGFGLSDLGQKVYKAIVGRDFDDHWGDNRHDPVLLWVFDKLGSKKASGSSAKLRAMKVSGAYFIYEYDGSESVLQPSTVKWTKV